MKKKLPTKKSLEHDIETICTDCGWVVGSSLKDLAEYFRDIIKPTVDEAYEDGFYDGQCESEGECECDCKKCDKCIFK